jgi:ABC-type methionine transport system ATPase subunit
VTDRQIKEVTDHLLERVGLADRADYYPGQLSGGQKQRVGIARALALNPPVLLADEITSGLDPTTTESILQLLAGLRDELDLAVILVTHEMSVVRTFADSVLLLENGRVVDRGRTGVLLRDIESRAGAELHRLGAPVAGDDDQVVELLYTSTTVPADWLSRLTRELDTEIDLLDASIERVGGHAHGRVRVRVADPAKHPALLDRAAALGLIAVVADHG